MLANIVLHTVLDQWFEHYAKPKIGGHARLIRFADDLVILCDRKEDAERFYAGIFPRFAKFGLELHSGKTKLVPFKRPPMGGPNDTESWDFLGFTHYWSTTRKGAWAIFQKTMASRLSRALNKAAEWCRKNRHMPVEDQLRTLSRKIRGHCAYYGITGNSAALEKYQRGVQHLWRKWLRRRSGAAKRKNWAWWDGFFKRYPLPTARAVHSTLRPT